jgi:hypothetical protein
LPRYTFLLRDSSGQEQVTLELEDQSEAEREARRAIADMVRDLLRRDIPRETIAVRVESAEDPIEISVSVDVWRG